ncbi:MAG: sigma-54-dependent Fis family transcriptional regulator [Planctomycetes bacterium]|nr:sigma-54-dependent Fis family transcriptional regulator [Planctomycetota bacterium]
MIQSILILDDGGPGLEALREAFQVEVRPEDEVHRVASMKELLGRLRDRSRFSIVVLPEAAGAGLLRKLRQADPEVPLILAAERGSVDRAARAIAAGASDFLVTGEKLRERIGTLLGKMRGLVGAIDRNRRLDEQNARLREAIQARFQIVGDSPQIQKMIDQLQKVARVPRPILITGERGTGKELVARAIHFTGGPPTRPIVSVNCAAFNDALLESELFGHEKGAFTGADEPRQGKFEQADGGTLFLDEIGNMSPVFQKKILRVVEYGTFTRVGGTRELRSSARILAATNVDLRERLRSGAFLSDLYDRLAFEIVAVPPLRERTGDVEVLARHFLNQFALEIPAFRDRRLSREALNRLKRHRFPGNVRELKNIIERAAYRDTGSEITLDDLGLILDDEPVAGRGGLHEKVEAYRRRLISEAIKESGGNQARAARSLGLSYHQFRYYYKKRRR